jgi:hypothetical protein
LFDLIPAKTTFWTMTQVIHVNPDFLVYTSCQFLFSFVETSRRTSKYLEMIRLEFILEEEYLNSFRRNLPHGNPVFDLARIFNACDNLKVSDF